MEEKNLLWFSQILNLTVSKENNLGILMNKSHCCVSAVVQEMKVPDHEIRGKEAD
jgi:hypothetical protein